MNYVAPVTVSRCGRFFVRGRCVRYNAGVMNPVFFPLLMTASILVALGVLLWLGSRERRLLRKEVDPELGEIRIFRGHWAVEKPVLLGGISVKLSGSGEETSISDVQRKTIGSLKEKLNPWTVAAIAAAKDHLRESKMSGSVDLTLDGVDIDEVEGSFELLLMSPDSPGLLPDGVAVEFAGEKIVGIEVVH